MHKGHEQADALASHAVGLNGLQIHRATAWVIAGDFSNTCGTSAEHAEHLENTPHRFREAGALVSPVQRCVLGCRSERFNFSSWLSTKVDLSGQRLVCKAFYQSPGYTTRAGRETTELTHRKQAVSGLSRGCFTAAEIH